MDDEHTPKTWLHFATLMNEATAEFIADRPVAMPDPQPLGIGKAVQKADRESAESIEASIRYFSRNKTWPKLTPLETSCIYARLEFAVGFLISYADFAEQLPPEAHPTTLKTCDEETIYELMLIEKWNRYGRAQVLSNTQCYLRLSGIETAQES